MPSRRALLVASFAALVSTALPALAEDGVTYQKLFFIQRSKNANEVHYDAKVTKDGSLDPKDPVVGYWLNKATDNSRESIGLLQKIAYGWDTEPGPNGTWSLKLKAFKERPMSIVKTSGKWRVQTSIAGKQAFLSRLYVATDESGAMPKVLYVDVFGEECDGGKSVQEHLVKN
jgi:hypothetical protein